MTPNNAINYLTTTSNDDTNQCAISLQKLNGKRRGLRCKVNYINNLIHMRFFKSFLKIFLPGKYPTRGSPTFMLRNFI